MDCKTLEAGRCFCTLLCAVTVAQARGCCTHYQTRQQGWTQRPEVWQTPRPARQGWVPLQRGGLETSFYSFMTSGLSPFLDSKAAFEKGLQQRLLRRGLCAASPGQWALLRVSEVIPATKHSGAFCPQDSLFQGMLLFRRGLILQGLNTNSPWQERAGSTQRLSLGSQSVHSIEAFFLPLILMHYSHIIRKSCRTFNYLLHNYNHICISISRSPVS